MPSPPPWPRPNLAASEKESKSLFNLPPTHSQTARTVRLGANNKSSYRRISRGIAVCKVLSVPGIPKI